MDYFVSAENTTYHHWQLELLIESFKHHGLQDKLCIAVAENEKSKVLPQFLNNFYEHERKFFHTNMGVQRGHKYLNQPYALEKTIDDGLIKQPFTVIEPDMVLYKPIQPQKHNVCFQIDPLFNRKYVVEQCPLADRHLRMFSRRKSENIWLPIGRIIILNDVPKEIFRRNCEWSEKLLNKQRKPWKHTVWVAWVLNLIELHGYAKFHGDFCYEMSMMEMNPNHNFINYRFGMPPAFSKYMFRYKPPEYFSLGVSPFELLAKEAPTPPAHYIQTLVKKYLERNK